MWDPTQYERFKDERTQPFRDLAALIERRPCMRVADLGCGTGELTRELHEQLAAEETLGIDSSESMLRRATPEGTLRFEIGDAGNFTTDRPFDLIFSNAALHWIPDHERLFTRLASMLTRPSATPPSSTASASHASTSDSRSTATCCRQPRMSSSGRRARR
jgi:trans-aconitate 2-methyltransferase